MRTGSNLCPFTPPLVLSAPLAAALAYGTDVSEGSAGKAASTESQRGSAGAAGQLLSTLLTDERYGAPSQQ